MDFSIGLVRFSMWQDLRSLYSGLFEFLLHYYRQYLIDRLPVPVEFEVIKGAIINSLLGRWELRLMINVLRKLSNNVFTIQAFNVWGPRDYARYLLRLFFVLPRIIESRNFSPLDQAMSDVTKTLSYRGNQFKFDCEWCDSRLSEESFGFGIVREIYIRD